MSTKETEANHTDSLGIWVMVFILMSIVGQWWYMFYTTHNENVRYETISTELDSLSTEVCRHQYDTLIVVTECNTVRYVTTTGNFPDIIYVVPDKQPTKETNKPKKK